ncbi:hypothetical protein CVT26_009448 [Gymnopilus dilepis]|uniref:Uncharacterized protein n=1 Tax=Gymnopilus dilepis TaxID=231916 RepID=A0A409YI96_9AGAR|nr:hypothetical protein CVT26_009448 [Gymnopilus dilepis]
MSKIAALQEKIRETKEALEDMLKQHHEMMIRANDVHDPFTSLLPPEIAAKIFHFCVLDLPQDGPQPRKMPLLLGAVCSHWRQIVWSTPDLWAEVAFQIRSLDFPTEEYCELAGEWLVRSGQLPLSITLSARFEGIPWGRHIDIYQRMFDQLIQVLNLHSRRWCTLEIHLPAGLVQGLGGSNYPAPQLQRLHIFLEAYTPWSRTGGVELIFEGANPKYLILQGQVPLQPLRIGWDNLIRAELEGYRVEEYLDFLDKSHALVQFKVVDALSGRDSLPCHVFHRNLRELSVDQSTSVDGSRLTGFLEGVTLPCLEKLSHTASSGTNPIPALISLVNRSGCVIRELFLDLEKALMIDDNLVTLLETTPKIQALVLIWSQGSLDLLCTFLRRLSHTAISTTSGSRSFVPELKSLSLFYGKMAYWDELAEIFGPFDVLGPDMRRRPLQDLEVYVEVMRQGDAEMDHINKESALRFLSLIRAGYSVQLWGVDSDDDDDTFIDLLNESIEHFDISPDIPS